MSPATVPSSTILHLVQKYLEQNGFESTSKSLRKELRSKKLSPSPVELDGQQEVSLDDVVQQWRKRGSKGGNDSSGLSSDGSESSDSASESESDTSVSAGLSSASSSGSTSNSEVSSVSESDVNATEKKAKDSRRRTKRSSPSSSSSSESDADDESETSSSSTKIKLQPKKQSLPPYAQGKLHTLPANTSQKRKRSPTPSESSSSGSDEDSEVSLPATKRTKTEVIVSDSDSTDTSSENDSDQEPSSDSSDAESEVSVEMTTAATTNQARNVDSDSAGGSTSSATVVGDKIPSSETVLGDDARATPRASVPQKRHIGAQPTPLAALSAKATPDSHISNAYQSYHYADRAYKDLSVTRGKGFTKEKNKKKRGSYRGGTIDISGGKAFKFED